ncbi:MAG: chorismate synthase, partial [Cyanobium sp. ELA712]
MGSSFGQLFRISTFGESHGGGVGVIVDGCPPRLPLYPEAIQAELDRRKPGQSRITTPRKEDDRVEILSGLLDGLTLGTPIAMVVRNTDQRPQDYREMEVAFRPSHADATYQAKYGIQARSGGGRASARETIGRVAAGAIAKQLLAHVAGTEVIAWVRRIHTIEASIDPATVSLEAVEGNIVRCPDGAAAERMIERIEAIGRDGDSCGGVIECLVRRPP